MTATIFVDVPRGGPIAVEMPGATSMGYAPMRGADALRLDDTGAPWVLVDGRTGRIMRVTDCVMDYRDRTFRLGAGQ